MTHENRPFDNGDENRKTTTPHSGGDHVPEEVRERPVREFSTPLDEAVRQGLVNTDPEQPYDGFEAAAPSASEKAGFDQKSSAARDSHNEEKKSRKGLYIGLGAGAAAVTLAAGIGIGSASSNNEAPTAPAEPSNEAPIVPGESVAPTEAPVEPSVSPSPSDIPTTFEPTPSETEAPSATASEVENSGEYTAAELREMPVDDYLALNTLEREPLIQEMLEESVDWAGFFGEDWQGDTSDLYKYNPLEIASKDNTPKEIAMQHLYWTQLGLMQTEDLGLSSTFDPDLATKALAGGFNQADYVGGDGRENLTKGMNNEIDLWRNIFANLGTFTNHQFAHDVTILDSNEGSARDSNNDRELKSITIDFTTEKLPETLGKDYQEGVTTQAHLSFVWNEEVERWQAYKGVGSSLPGGEGYN